MKYKNILVTGGLGFIGSNFLKLLVKKNIKAKIVCLDSQTYAANIQIKAKLKAQVTFINGDICDFELVNNLFTKFKFDLVVNFAASSHVDRSLQEHSTFLQTNILGVEILLSAINKIKNSMFVQISTDEVYGSLAINEIAKNENDMLKSSSIYSASKASAEQLVLAYNKSYNQKYLITRSSNNFGCFQHEEKFIPKVITNIYNGHKVPIYGNGENIRDWISCEQNVLAIYFLINNNVENEIVNVGANNLLTNNNIVTKICDLMKVEFADVVEYVNDRQGHDFKYHTNINKLSTLGYKVKFDFDKELNKTIKYYVRKGKNEL